MDINAAFPSNYIRAADLEGDKVVTIESVDIGDVSGDGEMKPIVHFADEKPMVLNKTNSHKISGMFGPETDNWHGQQIILTPTETEFRGKAVPCIRIKPVQPISPVAETVYQAALKYVTSLQAKQNDANEIAKVLVHLEQQHAAKSLTGDEYKELCKLAEKLPQLPSSDINLDLPF